MEHENKDDEISLIDLFAVLLRYRKLIIGMLLVSVLICIAIIFFSNFRNKDIELKYRSTAGAVITLTPGADFFLGNKNISDFFISPELITESFRYAIEQGASLEKMFQGGYIPLPVKADLPNTVKYESKNKKILLAEDSNTKVLNIQFSNSDPVKDRLFIEAMCSEVNRVINGYIRRAGENYILSYEKLISTAAPAEIDQVPLAEVGAYYFFAKDIISGDSDAIYFLTTPYSYSEGEEQKNSLQKISLIIIVGAFFFSIFLAFLFNAIQNIKQDPEAMSKINDALKKSQKGDA
ncbi:MAG: hypothetical protein LBR68_04860 [Lachnoclostridium sp.]|jgi:hypothetical protein|nr:hypothetical protein [Lachnoclostridium sp.]